MTLDGVNPFSMRMPRPADVKPVSSVGFQSALDNQGLYLGMASAANRALHEPSITKLWEDRSLIWAGRTLLGEMVDQAPRWLADPAGKPATQATLSKFANFGFEDVGKAAPPRIDRLTYGRILHLGDRTLPLDGKLNWTNFKALVQENTSGLKQMLRDPAARRNFFNFAPAQFAKETLWQYNVQPFKDLKTLAGGGTPESGAKWGRTLAGTFGLAFLGWGIVKSTRQAYQNGKALEDGSFSGRLKTWKDTAVAFTQKFLKSFAAWEVASIGMAAGKALIPVTTLGVCLPGIAIGALMAAVVYKGLDKLMPDPQPLQQSPSISVNPFLASTGT